jgi:cell division protein FtsB
LRDITKKKSNSKAPLAQFVAIIALSISIFLIVDLGRRAAANYRIQREAERLGQEVELAQQEQQALLAQRSYVASDLYIEEVARRELKWARPGEMVVVVMATPKAVTAQPNPQTVTKLSGPVPQTPAQAWWLLFFGPDPLP